MQAISRAGPNTALFVTVILSTFAANLAIVWCAQDRVVFPDMMISNYILHEPSKLIARVCWPVRRMM